MELQKNRTLSVNCTFLFVPKHKMKNRLSLNVGGREFECVEMYYLTIYELKKNYE